MAATGYTPISLYYSTTASTAPTAGNLVNGELAINITDGKLYYKDNTGTVKVIAGAGGAGIAGGSNTQVQYNSSGSLAGSSSMTFDGTYFTALGVRLANSSTNTIYRSAGGLQISTDGSGTTDDISIRPNYGSFVVSPGGTEALRLNLSGNLGLGVTPSAWFSTVRAFQFGSTGSLEGRTNSGSIALASNIYVDAGGDYRYITSNYATRYQQNAGQHIFSTAASGTAGNIPTFTQAMTLDASGNLVVGDTTAYEKLDVNGNMKLRIASSTTSRYLAFTNTAGTAGWSIGNGITASADQFVVYSNTAGAARMLIDSSGNLGIGTTSPSGRLHIVGGNSYFINTTSSQMYIRESSSGNNNTLILKADSGSASLTADYATTAIPMVFTTGGSERMRIDSSGNLLVGRTNQYNSEKFSVQQSANGQVAVFAQTYTTADVPALQIYQGYITGANTGTQIQFLKSGGGTVGSITSTTTATAYNTSSDIRLKDDLGLTTESIIDKVKVHNFAWKENGNKEIGVFAQELYEIKPNAVSKGATEEDIWGVDYSKLVPDLIVAIQQLKAEVDSLKAQLNK